jgi:hypothetical protein
MVSLTMFIVLALLAETIWQIIKMCVPKTYKIPDFLDVIGSIGIGVLLAVAANLDIFAVIGFTLNIPYLGVFLTGLIISRGSNFVHDILVRVAGIKQIKDIYTPGEGGTKTSYSGTGTAFVQIMPEVTAEKVNGVPPNRPLAATVNEAMEEATVTTDTETDVDEKDPG